MKNLFICSFLLSSISMAQAYTLLLDSNNSNDVLRKIPQNLMASFVDQGFKQVEVSSKIFELTIKNLRCDTNTRDVLYPDYSNAGLPSVKCYVNADLEKFERKGRAIEESRYIESLFSTIISMYKILIFQIVRWGESV